MIDLVQELSGRYQILDSLRQDPTGTSFAVQLSLPENLTYFKGHFPGFSVLPAMGLVDLSQFFVTQKAGKNRLQQIRRAKIKRPLSANQQVHIVFEMKGEDCAAVWSDPVDNSVIADIQFTLKF